jgi:hypothetical protein
MLLLCRFDVPEGGTAEFVEHAERALGLLTAHPGCTGGELARATEDAATWVLTVRFDSVVAYRRAMSGFEVREVVVPLLSQARTDDPAAYEVVVAAAGGTSSRYVSMLAKDADTVRPADAGGRAEPR